MSGVLDRRNDKPFDIGRFNRRRAGRGLPRPSEGQEVVFTLPTLENVDPSGVNGVSRLDEVEASIGLAGKSDHVTVRGKKRCSIGRIHDETSGNDQHESTLGR